MRRGRRARARRAWPQGAARPILPVPLSTNHRAPSGPAVMAEGNAIGDGTGTSITSPEGVILPMAFAVCSTTIFSIAWTLLPARVSALFRRCQ